MGTIKSTNMAPEHVWKYRREKSHNILIILAIYFVKKVFIKGNNSVPLIAPSHQPGHYHALLFPNSLLTYVSYEA